VLYYYYHDGDNVLCEYLCQVGDLTATRQYINAPEAIPSRCGLSKVIISLMNLGFVDRGEGLKKGLRVGSECIIMLNFFLAIADVFVIFALLKWYYR
jgi:hypothetical protein